MKPHIAKALQDELTRKVKSYDDLVLTRSKERPKLRTPHGDIALKSLGKGKFSKVYRASGNRVFAVSDQGVADKAISMASRSRENVHIPRVGHYGMTSRGQDVYQMPLYKAPLRKADSSLAWADYRVLRACQDAQLYSNQATVACALENGAQPSVTRDLNKMVTVADRFSPHYMLEFAPRNLATDRKGNLILLDVLFDVKQLMDKRRKKGRGSRDRG